MDKTLLYRPAKILFIAALATSIVVLLMLIVPLPYDATHYIRCCDKTSSASATYGAPFPILTSHVSGDSGQPLYDFHPSGFGANVAIWFALSCVILLLIAYSSVRFAHAKQKARNTMRRSVRH